jgi:hypothetical protein
MKTKINFLILALLFVSTIGMAQQIQMPQASPSSKIIQKVGLTDVTVDFSRPSTKGRKIFGELVPFGQVWRTGANEATEITFIKDVKISGKTVKAGTYTLFTIPQTNTWTLILNSELKQWGAYEYSKIKAKNVLSVELNVDTIKEQEKLTYSFTNNTKGTTLNIMWDNVKVSLPIQF